MENYSHVTICTERLFIERLSSNDNEFILKLVNTEGWIKFIGERNVYSLTDAIDYINRINGYPNVIYWVVKLKNDKSSIGIITFIKRDYLEGYDIGFAFLPEYGMRGYAYEATIAVLSRLFKKCNLSEIFAVTIPDNYKSIRLLEKVGLELHREIEVDKNKLLVFGNSKENLAFLKN